MNTRKYDFELLAQRRKEAKNAFQRDRIDKIVDSIGRENHVVSEKREKLIMAVRHDDIRNIKRLQHELNIISANRTYGKEY